MNELTDVLVNRAEAQEEVRCAGKSWTEFVQVHGACSHYVASTVLDWLYP